MFNACDTISVDTETTGLYPWHGDRLFAVSVSTHDSDFYFDFSLGDLPRSDLKLLVGAINRSERVFMMNARFDLSMFRVEGLHITAPVLDLGAMARVENNQHASRFFSLDYLADYYLRKRKDDSVENYVKEHSLYKTDVKGQRAPAFDQVPSEIMARYAKSDSRLTYDIGMEILRRVDEECRSYPTKRNLVDVIRNEANLTSVLHDIQHTGMRVDLDYCKRGMEQDLAFHRKTYESLKLKLGEKFNPDSPAQVASYVLSKGFELPKTPTGKPQATEKTLSSVDLPEIQEILSAKKSLKRANTYFKNFIELSDPDGFLHANLNQDTTVTGRMSGSSPNLQNLTKTETGEYVVRGAFVPRSDEHELFFLDYVRQEMHIIADQAEETPILDKMREGEDFYLATADKIKQSCGLEVSRSHAKAISLALAYGRGVRALAEELGIDTRVATELRSGFFKAMPGVLNLNQRLIKMFRVTGNVYNPFGRKLKVGYGKEYKCLNAFTQSTAADIGKHAMVACHNVLRGTRSRMIMAVHDEIVFDMHRDELGFLDFLKKEMVNAYPHRVLPLDVEIERGKRWSEKRLFA